MRKFLFRITLALATLGLLLGYALAGPEQDAKEAFEQGVAALTQGNPTLAVEKFTAALKIMGAGLLAPASSLRCPTVGQGSINVLPTSNVTA